MLTRRQFVKAALAAGAASAVPPVFESFLQSARAVTGPWNSYFLDVKDSTGQLKKTCQSLCDRIVPGPDGASDASAVVFIDRFLAAFELPPSVADRPAIYLTGNYSGRNPSPAEDDQKALTGTPSTGFPDDAFLDPPVGSLAPSGTAHFLGLTPAQELSWRYQLYGTPNCSGLPSSVWSNWAGQFASGGTLTPPVPAGGLRQQYIDGLGAFDSWSVQMFGAHYCDAPTQEQDLMLELAGNVLLGAVTGNVPLPWPTPPTPPAAARALFPIITLHTFQATYGLPEYSWRNQDNDSATVVKVDVTKKESAGGTAQWRAIGFDGDTQPLGNSLYDQNKVPEPGEEDPNAGYGDGLYTLTGGYTEWRPVSYLDPSTPLSPADAAALEQAINKVRGQAK